MMKCCDLHTHSVFSDGTFTPAQIIDLAEKAGLSAVALCDHNTVDGLEQFHAAAKGKEIEAIGGIELSTEYHGQDLHVLGLYIHPDHYESLTGLMEEANRKKTEANRNLVYALNAAGYRMDYDEICAATPGGHINRAHIAAALTAKGYTESVSDAFDTLLSEESGYYRVPDRINVFDAIRYLRSIGAVVILAHPFYDLTEQELEEFLVPALEAGLDGIEVLYSSYTMEERQIAARIAKSFDLVPGGGSDFHGANKPDIQIGCGKGDLFVPIAFLDAIKTRKNQR